MANAIRLWKAEEKSMKAAWLMAGGALAMAATSTFAAEVYPTKPIRLIAPFSPGGGTDILGRFLAIPMSEQLGQTIVVDNRPGAGGAIGAEMAATAEPDGYTLILISASYTATSAYRKTPYDPVNGIEPIALLGTTGLLMSANPKLGIGSVSELIKAAKANPGKINYASVGPGSVVHLTVELLKQMTGINIVHIPYKGAGPALNALIAGEAGVSVLSAVPSTPHVRAGRLRALAVTPAKRMATLPDVPTVSETVPGFVVDHWYGIWGPKGIPKSVVTLWNQKLAKVLHSPEIKKRLQNEGMQPAGGPPSQLHEYISRDVSRWLGVMKKAGIKRR
jgi:tripartite-type tricarboxylate transporter receptor subunit TctC